MKSIRDIITLYKHHKFINGTKRVLNELYENLFFDLKYKTSTSNLRFSKDYNIQNFDHNKHKWYQPTFYTPLKKVSIYISSLLQNHKDFSECKDVIIFDLGAGYGKPLIILNKYIKKNNFLYGVELDKFYEKGFYNNCSKYSKNFHFLNISVENVSFEKIIKDYSKNFILIVHNKNSFSKEITRNNLDSLRRISKKIPTFYIYSNPEFSDLFDKEEILYKTRGWHLNYNINLYKI